MAKYVDVSPERQAELEAEFGTERARTAAALELAKGMPGCAAVRVRNRYA